MTVYTCQTCGYETNYPTNYKAHLNKKKPCAIVNTEPKQKNIKMHRCDICGYETQYSTNYKNHINKKVPCSKAEILNEPAEETKQNEKVETVAKREIISVKTNKNTNMLTINEFFNNIDLSDAKKYIYLIKNIGGNTDRAKCIKILVNIVSEEYENIPFEKRPFICTDKFRNKIHYCMNPYEQTDEVTDILTPEEMVRKNYDKLKYRSNQREDGKFYFTKKSMTYNDDKKVWKFYTKSETIYEDFLHLLIGLQKRLCILYKPEFKIDMDIIKRTMDTDVVTNGFMTMSSLTFKISLCIEDIMEKLSDLSYNEKE